MIKKTEIAGVRLDNYTVREAMEQVESYWNNDVMNTIEAISVELLILAGEEEQLREGVESLDLTVINDEELLRAAGITSPQRIKETKERQFFAEFMKRLIRNGRTVYLVGDTIDQMDALNIFLKEYYGKLNVVGSLALEACSQDVDSLVNEINTISPDVVFSVLPTPRQEYFLMENRSRINARIWYGPGQAYDSQEEGFGIKRLVRRIIHRWKLRQMLAKYNKK